MSQAPLHLLLASPPSKQSPRFSPPSVRSLSPSFARAMLQTPEQRDTRIRPCGRTIGLQNVDSRLSAVLHHSAPPGPSQRPVTKTFNRTQPHRTNHTQPHAPNHARMTTRKHASHTIPTTHDHTNYALPTTRNRTFPTTQL